MTSSWIDELPSLRELDDEAKSTLQLSATRVTLPQGKIVFRPGDPCVNVSTYCVGLDKGSARHRERS